MRKLTETLVQNRVLEEHDDRVVMFEYAGTPKGDSAFRCRKCSKTWRTSAESVYRGSGCPHCAGNARVSEGDARARVHARHGDSIEMTLWGGAPLRPSTFRCLVCMWTWRTSAQHVYSGTGCARCSGNIVTEEEIRARLSERHGDRIIMVRYGGGLNRQSSFQCNKCELQWEATTSGPVTVGSGCPRCAGQLVTEDEIRARLRETHGDRIVMLRYGGGRFKYSLFRCGACAHEWETHTSNPVYVGSGCPACAGNARLSKEEMGARVREKHGGSVHLVRYGGNARSRSLFECSDCGHRWETIIQNVYDLGTGCSACAETGFDVSKPGTLYYARVDSVQGRYYKIGITNAEDAADRFRGEPGGRVEILDGWRFKHGQRAYDLEQFVLGHFSAWNAGFGQYDGPLRKGGNTELFTVDVIEELQGIVVEYLEAEETSLDRVVPSTDGAAHLAVALSQSERRMVRLGPPS